MRIFKCKNCGVEEEITSTTVLIGQCEVCEGVMTPLTTEKEPVAKLQCSDGLFAIREAWKEYNEIDGDYTYHLENGGDSHYDAEDVSKSWKKLNALIVGK